VPTFVAGRGSGEHEMGEPNHTGGALIADSLRK
jgi:hypothetical protein